MQDVLDLFIIGLLQKNNRITSKETNFYRIMNYEKNLHN